MPFWLKTVLLGQEVHYYMVYIAYFTELDSKIWDYAQKWRICRENCKYAQDKKFHGDFCPRRKAAKFCYPVSTWWVLWVHLLRSPLSHIYCLQSIWKLTKLIAFQLSLKHPSKMSCNKFYANWCWDKDNATRLCVNVFQIVLATYFRDNWFVVTSYSCSTRP